MLESTVNDIIRLRKERKTVRQIAKEVGVSKTLVANILNRHGYRGFLKYPELDDPKTFELPDEFLAAKLGVSKNRIFSARRKFGIKRPRYINLFSRRNDFFIDVFGKRYGPNYSDVTNFIRENLSQSQAEELISFYIEMRDNRDLYSRVTRVLAKEKLRSKVTDEVVRKLIENKVLQE